MQLMFSHKCCKSAERGHYARYACSLTFPQKYSFAPLRLSHILWSEVRLENEIDCDALNSQAAATTVQVAKTAFPGECPPVSKYLPDLGGNSPTNLEQGSEMFS